MLLLFAIPVFIALFNHQFCTVIFNRRNDNSTPAEYFAVILFFFYFAVLFFCIILSCLFIFAIIQYQQKTLSDQKSGEQRDPNHNHQSNEYYVRRLPRKITSLSQPPQNNFCPPYKDLIKVFNSFLVIVPSLSMTTMLPFLLLWGIGIIIGTSNLVRVGANSNNNYTDREIQDMHLFDWCTTDDQPVQWINKDEDAVNAKISAGARSALMFNEEGRIDDLDGFVNDRLSTLPSEVLGDNLPTIIIENDCASVTTSSEDCIFDYSTFINTIRFVLNIDSM